MDNRVQTKEIINNAAILGLIQNDIVSVVTQKNEIIDYLTNGEIIAAAAGRAKDILTGERIQGEWLTYTDGVYHWDTALIYYVENYNLKLPDEFLDHAMPTRQTA